MSARLDGPGCRKQGTLRIRSQDQTSAWCLPWPHAKPTWPMNSFLQEAVECWNAALQSADVRTDAHLLADVQAAIRNPSGVSAGLQALAGCTGCAVVVCGIWSVGGRLESYSRESRVGTCGCLDMHVRSDPGTCVHLHPPPPAAETVCVHARARCARMHAQVLLQLDLPSYLAAQLSGNRMVLLVSLLLLLLAGRLVEHSFQVLACTPAPAFLSSALLSLPFIHNPALFPNLGWGSE